MRLYDAYGDYVRNWRENLEDAAACGIIQNSSSLITILRVNLHQVLLHEALLRAGGPNHRLQSSTPLSAPNMDKQDEASWSAAINFCAA